MVFPQTLVLQQLPEVVLNNLTNKVEGVQSRFVIRDVVLLDKTPATVLIKIIAWLHRGVKLLKDV